LSRLWHLLGWLVIVEIFIIAFGLTGAPLLLVLVTDAAAVLVLIQRRAETRRALPVNVPAVQRGGAVNGAY
jgi:hypothetical protein